eukprot:scaffold6508_cov37-Tisochrysis_lutea.AAC.5
MGPFLDGVPQLRQGGHPSLRLLTLTALVKVKARAAARGHLFGRGPAVGRYGWLRGVRHVLVGRRGGVGGERRERRGVWRAP